MMPFKYNYYYAGILMGFGAGWVLASLLQGVFVEEFVTAREWAHMSLIVYLVLSFTGIFIIAGARRRKGLTAPPSSI